jgi:hypothetical protein
MIAKAARNAVPKKQKTSIGKRSSTSIGIRSGKPHSPVLDSVSQSTAETVSLSISRVVGDPIPAPVLPLSSKPKLVWSSSEKDELLKILAVPEPIPGKLRAVL